MIALSYAWPDLVAFSAAALMVVIGALGVITYRNPVHSAISLILTFLGVAVAFIDESAHFVAAVQVIVYAGAIVVLFLFVIMFLGIDEQEDVTLEPLVGQRPLAFAGVFVTVGGIIALVARGGWVTGASSVTGPTAVAHGTGPADNVRAVGESVFTTYLFAFEATAALLIIAVVGAVLLARRERVLESGEGQ